MTNGNVAVVDIGKTNAKVVLIGPDATELWERRLPNTVIDADPFPHFDSDTLWNFVVAALGDLPARPDCIVPVTHGACAALVDRDGELVFPVLDYEYAGPDEAAATYDAPPFEETGSPKMPGGLNVGRQLHWLQTTWPEAFNRSKYLLMWPQWWAYKLTGVPASELTSLGCHSDLWAPLAKKPSTLARARGWDGLIPPIRPANAVLGHLNSDVAATTGLPFDLPVLTGIHDSNASLLAYLDKSPCGVLSTGTWIVAMSINDVMPDLASAKDTLINVAADGRPIPTAPFMGGREREEALAAGVALEVTDQRAAEQAVERLNAIGATGPIFVEGPFAKSSIFLETLEAQTRRSVHGRVGSGTSAGASLLGKSLIQ